jgi:hypothetical protein
LERKEKYSALLKVSKVASVWSGDTVVAVLLILLVMSSSLLFAQDHKLVIQDGATFGGSGLIIVKDSIRNSNASSPTNIAGKVALSGSAQGIVCNGANGSLSIEALSVRGNGVKTITGTLSVTDSLNILTGASINISGDTLRIGNLSANSGTITPNSSSVIEFTSNNGNVQSILGGNIPCKVRLIGNSSKNLQGTLTVDSLEHSGWGLTINNDLTVKGSARIDSLINVANGISLSFGSNNGTVATLLGNDGIIQANSTGLLAFTNDATNGSGIIRTDNSTINFNGNINGTGTLAVTGSGTMTFTGAVSSTNYSFTNSSTEIYNGGDQIVVSTNYGNLALSNSGTKTFAPGTTGIGGTITRTSNAKADAMANMTTIDHNGTGAQTVGALDYYNLSLSNSHANQQITLINDDTIRVAGVFTNTATNVTFVNTNNTFEYNGNSPQTVTPFAYYNLIFDGSGAKTVDASQIANGDVIQQTGTVVTVSGSVAWQIDGSLSTNQNFVNNGDITIGN